MAQASVEKFEYTGLAEKERVASVPQGELWKVDQSRLCQKEKEQSRLSKAPDREVGRVKVSDSCTLSRERGSKREHEEQMVDFTVKEERFQGGEGGQAKRTSLGEVEDSISG